MADNIKDDLIEIEQALANVVTTAAGTATDLVKTALDTATSAVKVALGVVTGEK